MFNTGSYKLFKYCISYLKLDTKLYTLLYHCRRTKSGCFKESLFSADINALGKQKFGNVWNYCKSIAAKKVTWKRLKIFIYNIRRTLHTKIFPTWAPLFFMTCSSKKLATLYILRFGWKEKTLYFYIWLSSANRYVYYMNCIKCRGFINDILLLKWILIPIWWFLGIEIWNIFKSWFISNDINLRNNLWRINSPYIIIFCFLLWKEERLPIG